jgi:hypothetical protein
VAIIADIISPIVRKGIRNADGCAFYGMNSKWLAVNQQFIKAQSNASHWGKDFSWRTASHQQLYLSFMPHPKAQRPIASISVFNSSPS